MLKHIGKSFLLGTVVENRIKTDDAEQLEILKNGLKSRLAHPFGWHMMGLPLLISMIMLVFSFALIVSGAWTLIVSWSDISVRAAASAILPAALLYSIAIVTSLFFVARGYLRALKLYIFLILITVMSSAVFFLIAVASLIAPNDTPSPLSIAAGISLILGLAAIKCINSSMFEKTMALFFHNRVWRKQLNLRKF